MTNIKFHHNPEVVIHEVKPVFKGIDAADLLKMPQWPGTLGFLLTPNAPDTIEKRNAVLEKYREILDGLQLMWVDRIVYGLQQQIDQVLFFADALDDLKHSNDMQDRVLFNRIGSHYPEEWIFAIERDLYWHSEKMMGMTEKKYEEYRSDLQSWELDSGVL